MIRIAIVDDEIEQIREIEEIVSDFFQYNQMEFQIYKFLSGEALLEHSSNMDLVFLDIQMGGIDGIETAQRLRSKNKRVVLLYMTNYVKEMARSFAVHPFAFIEKPICKEKVISNLQDYLDYTSATTSKKMVTLKGEQGDFTVCVQDIIYLEYMENRRIKMHIGNDEKIMYGGLTEMMTLLEPYDFILPHKSFLINQAQIQAVYPHSILMKNQEEVPIAQKKSKQIVEQISYFLHHQLKGET